MASHSQNRTRRHQSERKVIAAIGPTQERVGGWFTAQELLSGLSVTTNRKYLDLLAESGIVEREVVGGRTQNNVMYRRNCGAQGEDHAD